MPHVIETAVSGRSRCRGCRGAIAKDTVRFGEQLDNPYADGYVTVWYHLQCAAWRRPESFLASLAGDGDVPEHARRLQPVARHSSDHRRVCRIAGVERASSGRARCRHCRELIARDTLRIPLLFHEEGMFNASGFVHVSCAPDYFETAELIDCIRYFTPDLGDADLRELRTLLE